MTGRPLLALDRLDAWYGRAQALFGVDLTVGTGEAVALLGRNGAGKTTTLRAILGLLPRVGGSVRYRDHDLSRLPTHRIARLGIGYVPEERRIFTGLTVAENLQLGCRPARPGLPVWTPERLFRLFPGLVALQDRRGGRLSGGEQQMLALARTLMGNPALLLLDEPSEGLAPRLVEDLTDALIRLKGEGVSVLLSEQNAGFAASLCDRAYVLAQGRIRATGSVAPLLADPQVRREWLAL